MNRFHLLSLDDENTSTPVAPAPAAAPASAFDAKSSVKKAIRKEAGTGRNDRKSHSAPRKDGEKHRNVGKGSWGRPTDGAIPEPEESVAVEEVAGAVDDEAAKPEAPEPPKPVYKTVNQFLKEQAEQQRRLAARSTVSVRSVNEGAEIDNDLQVVRKDDQVMIFGAKKTAPNTLSVPNTLSAPKASGKSRISLQDLSKILPQATPAAPREHTDRRDAERTPRGSSSQSHRSREQQDGEKRPRDERRSHGDRRPSAPKPVHEGFKAARIDLSDSKAFPSLA